ncbi:MAG: hypothetical protein ABH824_06250 [Nanoarchaeota archaeon]|nr:hypothetical protein [Nanoarchaeota archaeon]MBU1632062.1 hypothetical protein [Nanoarchaeota archaeon]MBU1875896.1 hypothetical protein [Nanoarchaeota archaeon]
MLDKISEKERRKELHIAYTVLVILIIIIGIIFIFSPNLTGLIVYEDQTENLRLAAFEISDYNYNESLIQVNNSQIQLIPITTDFHWNTSVETEYSLISALYNPSDKTDKINQLDNKKLEVNENKILDVFFEDNLDNGDIISIYVDEGKEGIIYLCENGIICDSSNLGFVNYDGEEGWYNLTINGLTSSLKYFNIHPSEKIKINQITSNKGEIDKALFNPSDKTDKVNELDNKKHQINKEIFNLIFDSEINNGDIISLYIDNNNDNNDNDNETNIFLIFLCNYGNACSSPGYGLVSYDGEEGWYNITVDGLSSSTNSLNLYSSKVKINYIKAVHHDYEEHVSQNTTYAASAEITTIDLEPDNLDSWGDFFTEEEFNEQSIEYQYSIDSGITWIEVPENNNLSAINSDKIMFKAILNSDGEMTPILKNMKVSFATINPKCIENWTANYGECLNDDLKLKYYLDNNECETTNYLPEDNGTYQVCDYCTPNLSNISEDGWVDVNGCRPNNLKLQNRTLIQFDTNYCREIDNQTFMQQQYVECDYCSSHNCTGSFENSFSYNQERFLEIDTNNRTNAKLEINSTTTNTNFNLTVIEYNWTEKELPSTVKPVERYIDIESNIENISSAKITIYYHEENLANIDESTLKIHYYNETGQKWEELNSIVNLTENYVYTITNHFSLYGLFGQEEVSSPPSSNPETSGSSSSGGGSGGGGGGIGSFMLSDNEKNSEENVDNNNLAKVTKSVTNKKEEKTDNLMVKKNNCEYNLNVSLPERISFLKQKSFEIEVVNEGNCDIENLKLNLSEELEPITTIVNPIIEEIKQENKNIFQINKKDDNRLITLLVGSAVADRFSAKKIKGMITLTFDVPNNYDNGLIEKEIPVEVEVLSAEKVFDNMKPLIFNFSSLTILILAGFLFVLKRKKEEKKKKKQNYKKIVNR